MNNVMLIIALLLILVVIGIVVWLYLENQKIKQEQQNLQSEFEKVNRDLAGLCSAAVNVDARLLKNNKVLMAMVKDLEEILAPESEIETEVTSQPYQDIIQMVKTGTEPEELVHQFGVSFDEAALLIRLHGTEKMKT